METIGKAVAGIAVGLFSLWLFFALAVVGIYNDCIRHEASIKAQYKENQNNYDKLFKTVVEQAQVKASYAKDLKELYEATGKTRYGPGGSKAVLQFIKEHNPTLDPEVYRQLMRTIESGRIDFESKQASLIDRKRVYESAILNTAVTGTIAKFLGFPKIDLNKMDIVTSGETEAAFETKKAGAFKLD